MILTATKQKKIVEDARRLMRDYYDRVLNADGSNKPIEKFCLFWAFFTMVALKEHGVEGVFLQAGTAFWPFKPSDGGPYQYGYDFVWDAQSMTYVLTATLPEMHVWVVIAQDQAVEVVDLTAPFFKTVAEENGFTWTLPDPPEFFWSDSLPEGVVYIAKRKAIAIAQSFLSNAFKDNREGVFVVRLKV